MVHHVTAGFHIGVADLDMADAPLTNNQVFRIIMSYARDLGEKRQCLMLEYIPVNLKIAIPGGETTIRYAMFEK